MEATTVVANFALAKVSLPPSGRLQIKRVLVNGRPWE